MAGAARALPRRLVGLCPLLVDAPAARAWGRSRKPPCARASSAVTFSRRPCAVGLKPGRLLSRVEGPAEQSKRGTTLEVVVQENENLERALRRFKRKVQRSGLYSELRKRRFYEKPSAQRKRRREAAIRRERRRQRRSRR